MAQIRTTASRSILAALFIAFGYQLVHLQPVDRFLGIEVRTEVRAIIKEIEAKTGKRIHSEFIRQPESQFGSSFIDDDSGTAFVLIDLSLRGDNRKLEAVIAHELLHMRLRVNNYPTFIFSPSVRTAKGRAIDVEQERVNDLLSMIEHRVLKTDMEKLGVNRYIDLAGDTAENARMRKGEPDSQADSINYARAILEYSNPSDVNTVKQIFQSNGWTRALTDGASISNLISQGNPRTPTDVERIFLACLRILYPSPKATVAFKLTNDPTNRYFRRMVINLSQVVRKGR